jgi:hypothetical protein
MARLSRTLIVGILVVATTAACGGSPGGGSGTPSPSLDGSPVAGGSPSAAGSPSTAPTTATADPWVLDTDGIGPYRLGMRSAELAYEGLMGTATPINSADCPELYSVAATGTYAGTLLLVLRHNVLVQIGTAGGGPVHSPEGVRVGDTLDSARTTYGTRATARTGADGLPGLVVTAGDRVLLFTGHPIRPGIGWFAAGYANHTEATFVSGDDC